MSHLSNYWKAKPYTSRSIVSNHCAPLNHLSGSWLIVWTLIHVQNLVLPLCKTTPSIVKVQSKLIMALISCLVAPLKSWNSQTCLLRSLQAWESRCPGMHAPVVEILFSSLQFMVSHHWDDGVHMMMYAVREVIQESLGFSLCDLVFAHTVGGLLRSVVKPGNTAKSVRLCVLV